MTTPHLIATYDGWIFSASGNTVRKKGRNNQESERPALSDQLEMAYAGVYQVVCRVFGGYIEDRAECDIVK